MKEKQKENIAKWASIIGIILLILKAFGVI